MQKFKKFLARNDLDAKPFQAECFEWCLGREQPPQQKDLPLGGILALEMGLGKTIIMLGLIECNFQQHTLIILPRALLAQWESCIQNYFGHQPLIYHGSRPRSLKLTLSEIQAKPIVLTTYGQISMPSTKQKNRGRSLSLLHAIKWDRIICDEGHHVSHAGTNEFKGMQALNASIRWLVTGTPIQNTEHELNNLFALLGIKKSQIALNELDLVEKLVFHKTKASAGIVLPTLRQHTLTVPWTNIAEQQYASHVHSLLRFCHIPQKPIAQELQEEHTDWSLIMQYMMKAKQMCVYPPMMSKQTVWDFTKGLEHYKVQEDNPYPAMNATELTRACSKIDAVIQTLATRKGNGCGKIVFCHFYAEMDILEKRLLQEHGYTRVRKLDGRVKSNKLRREILSDPTNEVLLAQIKMCSEGLNLQENYSEVYFTSPHFNPATEDQAIARCWRIGQTKEVDVFRYIMEETIEPEPEAPQAPAVPQEQAYSLDSYCMKLQKRKREIMATMETAARK